MPGKKQKCYVYTRVSTQTQAVDGYSLDAQSSRLRQAAEYHQLSIVREFSDAGISGKNTTDRPQFTEMLRLIASGNPRRRTVCPGLQALPLRPERRRRAV